MKTRETVADVIIRPNVAHISPSSFDLTDECVALGEAAAVEMLPQLRSLMESSDQYIVATGESH